MSVFLSSDLGHIIFAAVKNLIDSDSILGVRIDFLVFLFFCISIGLSFRLTALFNQRLKMNTFIAVSCISAALLFFDRLALMFLISWIAVTLSNTFYARESAFSDRFFWKLVMISFPTFAVVTFQAFTSSVLKTNSLFEDTKIWEQVFEVLAGQWERLIAWFILASLLGILSRKVPSQYKNYVLGFMQSVCFIDLSSEILGRTDLFLCFSVIAGFFSGGLELFLSRLRPVNSNPVDAFRI